VIDRIAELMKHETAGDPMTGLRWTHKTTVKIAEELLALGIDVGPRTIARLLRQMGFSLRVNHKKLARISGTAPEDRDAQFAFIKELRERCAAEQVPLISVDTKKKELIGQFKNPGALWSQDPIKVNDHDFPSEAIGKAIPYGIYDLLANRGTVFVGTSIDTPKFAVDSIETWWSTEARDRYPEANELVILADGGGSNASNSRVWKHDIATQLCARHSITVKVAHYPPGASKWNPIEHRLFSEISKNWAGRPLDSYETALNYIRSTTTTTGLRVRAHLVEQQYEKGIKISDAQMEALPIVRHESLPKWNYTIQPA